jgi:hypothetical protein
MVIEKAFFSTESNRSSTADFGFKDVNASEKQNMVKEVFSKVADKYDVMNDLMSLGNSNPNSNPNSDSNPNPNYHPNSDSDSNSNPNANEFRCS